MKNVAALLCSICFLLSGSALADCTLTSDLQLGADKNFPNAYSCNTRDDGFCEIHLSDLYCLQSMEASGNSVPPIALESGEVVIWVGDLRTPTTGAACRTNIQSCPGFVFSQFKTHAAGGICGQADTTHRPFANKFDNDKKDDGAKSPRYEHLKATTVADDTTNGCYSHSIQLNDTGNTTIDPHIIIGGTGLVGLKFFNLELTRLHSGHAAKSVAKPKANPQHN